MILILALVSGKAYERHTARSLTQLSELVRAMRHIRGRIATYLSPRSELFSGFESDELERVGFLSRIRDGKGLKSALEESGLLIPKDAVRCAAELFDGLGRGYKGEVLALADSVIGECEAILSRERESSPRDTRVVKTLLSCGALALIILIL